MFANVIVDISHEKLDRTFQYRVPETFSEKVKPGVVVEIPFGKGNRLIKGYVVEVTSRAEFDEEKMKEIHSVSTDGIGVESRLIALASWIREYYGSTMIQALKTVLPVREKERRKEQKKLCLKVSREEGEKAREFFGQKNQKARLRLMEALLETEELSWEIATKKLNLSPALIRTMEEKGLVKVESSTVYRNPIRLHGVQQEKKELNKEQRQVVEGILRCWKEDAKPCLLHGVTGSGKTEVYMELIEAVLAEGKQAIVLIPEIALTYQTVLRFYRRFGERISILNSRLSKGERFDQYERARTEQVDVIIGPRSALFAPFPNLGLIIMDEEHEPSYKSESVPRYHTREVAEKRASLEGARVVFGSATPSVEAYRKAERGEYHLFAMKKRVKDQPLPSVEIVDLKEELKEGNRSVLSRRLREEMALCLAARHQMMLFLNRRGYAGFLSCRSCGTVLKCPHCDVSLSVHSNGKLVCHYCGYEEPKKERCPKCGSPFLREFGIGTQQVERIVQKEFPGARVLRMDLDTTREKDGHEKILEAFAHHEADILIGTQMIVKGHDFPDVTLVGVLAADLSLHAADYRAAERTFQLLTQAAGRAGRGDVPGRVVIQTYDPDHYSIQASKDQDYQMFYQREILYRRISVYPPEGAMLAIHASGTDEGYLSVAMDYLKKFISRFEDKTGIGIIGPADETIAKISDHYRKVLYVKHEDEKVLTMIKEKVEQYMEINEGFRAVHIQFDRNE